MFYFSIRNLVNRLAVATIAVLCSGATYASQTDKELILEKLAALESRIAALETENRAIRRDAAEARAQARRATAARAEPSSFVSPSDARSSLAYKAEPAERNPSAAWSGAYWGASAGGAATRSTTTSSERYTSSFAVNPPPFDMTGVDMSSTSGPGKAAGALIDTFVGWNVQLAPRVVVGAQLEATAANLNFGSAGVKNYTYFNSDGPTGQTAAGDFRPQVASRWMATALLRAGVLLNEQTLVYGTGGWTIAQFEVRNVTENPFFQPVETFLANGWTAGVGIERKLDSNWSIRAEYRYTKFGTTTVSDHYSFQGLSGGAGNSQTDQRQTQFDQSMQAGRIGVAYSFYSLR